MIKKLSIILVVFSFVLIPSGRAQLRLKPIAWGMKAGIDLSKPSFNNGLFQTSNFTGFQVGTTVDYWLDSENYTIPFDVAILFNYYGVKFKFDGQNFKSAQSALEIPVNLKFPLLGRGGEAYTIAGLFLTAGPYVSFKLNGDKFSVISEGIQNDFKSEPFGAGINLGISLGIYPLYMFSANYKIGLTNDYKSLGTGNLDLRGKTRMWSFTLTLPLHMFFD